MPKMSKGSVATYLRCGGIIHDDFIANTLLLPSVKELLQELIRR